ncbi:hypothetical protein BsWGS_11903 [Bradybaena similaris]
MDKSTVTKVTDQPKVTNVAQQSTVTKGMDTSTVTKGMDTSTVTKGMDTSTVTKVIDQPIVTKATEQPTVMKAIDKSAVTDVIDLSTVTKVTDQPTVMKTKNASTMKKVKAGTSSPPGHLLQALKPKKRRNSGSDVENNEGSHDDLEGLRVRFWSVRQKKSKRCFLRVSASLASLISKSRRKTGSDSCKKSTLSLSYIPPNPSPTKRRTQQTWIDSFGSEKGGFGIPDLSGTDIKRQEAIYELYKGEQDMVEDLIMVTKMYRDSLLTLGLMTHAEVSILFGNIDSLIPLHQDLLARLQCQRKPDGTTQNVGKQIYEWSRGLHVYVNYCANQIKAKCVYDDKRHEPSVEDFLERCLASPLSHKLDLWSLLDGARSHFVKYPLLVNSILKYTPSDSSDADLLKQSIKVIENIIHEADEQMGVASCEQCRSTLVYLFEDQKIVEIEESVTLVCSGCMKNIKGNKLFVFLFDKAVVVSRSIIQDGRQLYQVYRQPIPVAELVVEDLPDSEVKLGSFRSAFGQGGCTVKNLIRISFQNCDRGQSHTLVANDEHDKRQWMHAFQKITSKILTVVGESKLKDRQLNS